MASSVVSTASAATATHVNGLKKTLNSNVLDDPTYPTLRGDTPARTEFAFDDTDEALEAFKRGEFLVVMDDENRENEGDLIISAAHCTTEKMAWMIKHTRSVVFILYFHIHLPPAKYTYRQLMDIVVGTYVLPFLERG